MSTEHTLARDSQTWDAYCTTCNSRAAFGRISQTCAPHSVREAAYKAAREAGEGHYAALEAYDAPYGPDKIPPPPASAQRLQSRVHQVSSTAGLQSWTAAQR